MDATTATSSSPFSSSPFSSSPFSSSATTLSSAPATTSVSCAPLSRPKPIRCDITPLVVQEGEVIKESQIIEDDLDSAYDTFQVLAANVYSLSAPTVKIQDIAKTWRNQAQDLQNKIQAFRTKLEGLQQKVSFLPAVHLVPSIQRLHALAMRLITLQDSVIKIKFVNSPIYTEAYTVCRNAIKACEELCKNQETQKLGPQKLQSCKALFSETQRAINHQKTQLLSLDTDSDENQDIIVRVLELHLSIFEVFHHRMSRILTDRDFLQSIAQEISTTKAFFKTQAALLVNMTPCTQLSEYEKSYESVALPQLFNFHQANFVKGFFEIHFKYDNIASIIEEMKNVARGIYKLQCDLQKAISAYAHASRQNQEGIKNITQEYHLYEAAYHSLFKKLQVFKSQLLNNATSGEIHAGLYYDALLKRLLSEVKYQIVFFKKCVINDTEPNKETALTQLFIAQNKLHAVLNPSTDATRYDTIREFYHITKTLSDFPESSTHEDPDIRYLQTTAHKTLRYAMALQQQKVLKPVSLVRSIAEMIVDQTLLESTASGAQPESSQTLSDQIKTTLAQEMITQLYFPQNTSTFTLDVVLTAIQDAECYPYLYSSSQGKGFSEIVTQYEKARSPLTESVRNAIKTFTRYFSLAKKCLTQTSPSRPLSRTSLATFFTYCESQVAYSACERVQQDQKNLLDAEQKEFFKKMFSHRVLQKQQELKRSFDYTFMLAEIEQDNEKFTTQIYRSRKNGKLIGNILFTTVSQALYKQGPEQAHAKLCLDTFLKAEMHDFSLPEVGDVKFLLTTYILAKMKDSTFTLSTFGKNYLIDFYGGFLVDKTIRDHFYKNFGPLFMELQLYVLLEPHRASTEKSIEAKAMCQSVIRSQARGQQGLDEWINAMQHCKSFYEGPSQDHVDALSGYLRTNQMAFRQAGAYNDALIACLTHMQDTL
jgi:hypothetical protein